jgi:putative intracellular protease/amidase
MERTRVGILIFDDVEVLDFCGPFEVFSVTRLDEGRRLQEPSPFEVLLVAETLDYITTSGGMRVLPEVDFESCPRLDILVVPGGMGTRREMSNEAVLAFVKTQEKTADLVASVCTGSLILGKAGLLEGMHATTHWASLDLLRQLFPNVQVDEFSHVVDQGRILTSAGISAGIDLALRVVARRCGENVARAAARRMEYPFPEGNGRKIRLGTPGPYRVDFEAMPWVSPMEGVRCKIHAEGDKRLRLVEYSSAMPVHWCAKGHFGRILEGEFEIEFDRETIVFRAGDGVFIPDGPEHRHRARALTETVTALFVESV